MPSNQQIRLKRDQSVMHDHAGVSSRDHGQDYEDLLKSRREVGHLRQKIRLLEGRDNVSAANDAIRRAGFFKASSTNRWHEANENKREVAYLRGQVQKYRSLWQAAVRKLASLPRPTAAHQEASR